MSQGEAEGEPTMDHTAALMAPENVLPLARAVAAVTVIGLAQATSVALDSLAGGQAVLSEVLRGPIDVLAKASLVLLVLQTAATGLRLVCPRAGGVRSRSTDVSTKQGWFW